MSQELSQKGMGLFLVFVGLFLFVLLYGCFNHNFVTFLVQPNFFRMQQIHIQTSCLLGVVFCFVGAGGGGGGGEILKNAQTGTMFR